MFQIPIGVIGIPIGVVMLPSMSRDLARGDVASYASLVGRALRLIIWVMLPLAALTIVLRSEIVTLLFGYGRFDERGVTLTAAVLMCLSFALASESLIAILARAFYASRDTLTPVAAAVLAVILNVSLAVVLVGPLGLAGIGVAIAVGSWVEALVLLVILNRRIGGFQLGRWPGRVPWRWSGRSWPAPWRGRHPRSWTVRSGPNRHGSSFSPSSPWRRGWRPAYPG